MPEIMTVDWVEQCARLDRENAALQRLRRQVSSDLAVERIARYANERALRSCRNALAFAASLASIEFVAIVVVILWLRGDA